MGLPLYYFYDCDYLYWADYGIGYSVVSGYCYNGSVCGFTPLSLRFGVLGADWIVGAYLILFYDCDNLGWLDSDGYFPYVGGSCLYDSAGGSFAILLHNVAEYTYWYIGASLIIFYNCDRLGWYAHDIFYANISGSSSDNLLCGSFCTRLSLAAANGNWSLGASKDYFYDCDRFAWDASGVRYAFIGGLCYAGSFCGSFYTNLYYDVTVTDWIFGAYLIIFYDCDFLGWDASAIQYAFIGGHCDSGSIWGSFVLYLTDAAIFMNWHVGAYY